MRELQTEIQNNIERKTQHANQLGLTTTAVEVSTSNNKPIQLLHIYVPNKGANANSVGAIAMVSFDGTNYMSYPRGTNEMWPGKGYDSGGFEGNTIKVKSYSGTINIEIKLVS